MGVYNITAKFSKHYSAVLRYACPGVYGAMDSDKKIFKLVWRCHQLLSGFLANGHSYIDPLLNSYGQV